MSSQLAPPKMIGSRGYASLSRRASARGETRREADSIKGGPVHTGQAPVDKGLGLRASAGQRRQCGIVGHVTGEAFAEHIPVGLVRRRAGTEQRGGKHPVTG